jgi:hypothetical protein
VPLHLQSVPLHLQSVPLHLQSVPLHLQSVPLHLQKPGRDMVLTDRRQAFGLSGLVDHNGQMRRRVQSGVVGSLALGTRSRRY